MSRVLAAGVVAASALALTGAGGAAAPASVQRFSATADGFVSAAAPRTSYGRARTLLLRAKPPARAYLRFRVAGLSGDVLSAQLRVFVRGRGQLQVRQVARRRWTERSLTYRSAPRLKRVVASARVSRGWRHLDVSSLVRRAGVVELSLVARRGSLSVSSRETGLKPALVVSTAPVLLAAGDIASCNSNGDEQTAALLKGVPATIAAVGDLAYESGTEAEFDNCYNPSWGRFKAKTHPALGNHEYLTPGAAGYFGYWGAAAGAPAGGYYSYDLGSWHVVVLNSNCSFVDCARGSLQETWLRSDLAQHPASCTLAYWHHPLFSSTVGTVSTAVRPLWQALYDAGADIVVTGHAHNYQRFAPQAPDGGADPARGLREFVVGTGGRTRVPVGPPVANQEAANSSTYGVLKLTLLPNGYRWQFMPATGGVFADSGSGVCH